MSDLSVSGVSSGAELYGTQNVSSSPKTEEAKTEEVKKETEGKAAENGVVYDKTEAGSSDKKATYSVNKMSQQDRTALINQLKADQANRQQQLTEMVAKMMGQQANTYGNANDIWKFLADGKFEVDPETKAQAEKDIAEDGYWGVSQTSQRMFDFASALAGDDVEQMKKMQEAMQKGYKMAEETWGKELPELSKQTLEAANKLFDDYYASKEVEA